jgi:hypothetical protein
MRFSAVSGTHGANHFVLRRTGANLQLLDTDTGAMLRDVALARTSAVSITGANGRVDNTLTLDFSGGSLAVPGGISYSGGQGGYNVLALRGGHFPHEREVAYTPHSGLMVLGDTTIHYAEIAPINDTVPAASYTLNATAASETINVVNGPVVSGVQTTQVNDGSGGTFELVNFANKPSVTINGGGGSDTFNLNNTLPAVGLSALALDSSPGAASTFNLTATSAAVPVSLVGGGADTANVGTGSAQSIASAVSVSDPTNYIALNVDDSANSSSSRFVTLSSNGATDTISGLAPATITGGVNDLKSITLSGGSVGNTFVVSGVTGPSGLTLPVNLNTGTGVDSTFVQNVAAGSSLAVHGQDGSDGVAISNAGSVQGLHGPVSVDNIFSFTNLVIDDSNDTTARTVSLSSDGTTDTISGLAPSDITAKATDLAHFTLDGGNGGNTLTLADFDTPGDVTLNTGTGADTTSVQKTTNATTLDINGQTGSDTVELGSGGSVQELSGAVTVTNGGATALTVNDASDTTARTVTVSPTSVTGLAPKPIEYTSSLSTLSIEGGGPSDTFAVTPSATTSENIVGDGTASAPALANTLTMSLTGADTPALSGTPSTAGAQGTWTFANRSPVSFSHMQSLNPTALSVGDAATTVGGSGSSPLLFPVSLLAASAQPVSATYATADGSATVASGAYQPASGTVFFPAGATSETVLVNALGMPTAHPPQTLVLALIEPVNAFFGRSVATGTITDSFVPALPSGATVAPTPTQVTQGPTAVAPVLTNLTQTRTSWREGKALAVISSKRKRLASVGTKFSFSLNESANVALVFSQSVGGRKAHGRCVTQTKTNTKSRPCQRSVTQGTLPMTAHAGVNHISFQGRFSHTGTLKPGRYTLSATATNSAGDRSHPSTLTFTIIK